MYSVFRPECGESNAPSSSQCDFAISFISMSWYRVDRYVVYCVRFYSDERYGQRHLTKFFFNYITLPKIVKEVTLV